MATPYALIVLEDVQSTQDEAVARADESPILVVAARQSAGRGRWGRPWEAAPRAIAASLAVRPSEWHPHEFGRLSLVAALAARAVLGEEFACKWPNDLVRDGRKVAGLLLEATGGQVVVGLGVNLWWPDCPAGIGAVRQTDPGPEVVVDLASQWCGELLDRIEKGPEQWGRDEYLAACRTVGRTVEWQPGGRGEAIDVDEDGRLVVQTSHEVVHLSSGEVREIR